jgi:hypothetical protein
MGVIVYLGLAQWLLLDVVAGAVGPR